MGNSSDPALCPHCGRPLPLLPSSHGSALIFASEPSQTVETLIPATLCTDEAAGRYGDSNGFVLASHVTGEDETPAPISPQIPESDELADARVDGSSDYDPLHSPVADPILEVIAQSEPGPIVSPLPAHASSAHQMTPQGQSSASVDDDHRQGMSWTMLLVASYASAMTIAVAWLLWQGAGRRSVSGDTLPVPARATSARDLRPLAPERRTSIGRPLRVGSLEITAVALKESPIGITWTTADGDREKDSAPGCLSLRVRFKNVSADETFVPLEPAWVRRADSGEGEAFLMSDSGIIEAFPLALNSEKSIVGQTFPRLKPGESGETVIVAESGASALSSPATWRLKVRVTSDQTATIGIDIRPEDVH